MCECRRIVSLHTTEASLRALVWKCEIKQDATWTWIPRVLRWEMSGSFGCVLISGVEPSGYQRTNLLCSCLFIFAYQDDPKKQILFPFCNLSLRVQSVPQPHNMHVSVTGDECIAFILHLFSTAVFWYWGFHYSLSRSLIRIWVQFVRCARGLCMT